MLEEKFIGKPDAGNPHVRFDEGKGRCSAWYVDIEPQRGNPATEVGQNLNSTSPFLLYLNPLNPVRQGKVYESHKLKGAYHDKYLLVM